MYDLTENRGTFVVGVSHDTPAFAAHAIAHWCDQEGSQRYSGSRRILILSQTGGSNGYRCYAWKAEVQSQLANSFALSVTVAHYLPGALPNGIPSSIVFFPRCHETGLGNRSTP